jgi:hypothetical protein
MPDPKPIGRSTSEFYRAPRRPPVLEPSSLERPLPQNVEAERSILGAILLDNSKLTEVTAKIKPEDFFHDHHRRIFRQMAALGQAQQAIDLVTLTDQLHRAGELESSGGHAYISQLMDGVPHVTNVEHYVRIVKEKSQQRAIIHETDAIQRQAFDGVIGQAGIERLFKIASADTAAAGRPNFNWNDLETEAELMAGSTGALPYTVDGIIPADDLTMFVGREGSCKTLLALYLAKCIANGAPAFGCIATTKKSVLYLDAENHPGTHQVYLPFFESIGPEQIRFRTLRYGIPALTDPALIRLCQEMRPFLVIDSLIRFSGTRDRDSSEMTELMEQLARLVTAGATVLLIHHTRRSDDEEYANSFAVGATVAFWYAIVKEDTGLVKRVKMVHKKARGATEKHRDLIAFPAILDRAMFVLDGDVPKTDKELVLDFVRGRGRCNFTAIKNDLRGIGILSKKTALDEAIAAGELVKNSVGREVFFSAQEIGSGARTPGFQFRTVPELEPMEDRTDANDQE